MYIKNKILSLLCLAFGICLTTARWYFLGGYAVFMAALLHGLTVYSSETTYSFDDESDASHDRKDDAHTKQSTFKDTTQEEDAHEIR